MKAGNIIVNALQSGVFIFSPDLKKLLHRRVFETSVDHWVHEVQVNHLGEYVFFNNRVLNPEQSLFSAVQKFDERKGKVTFDFRASPPELFYSNESGGVQEFEDSYFFYHRFTGVYLYSKVKKRITFSLPGHNGNPGDNSPVQQVKIVDVSEFLKNSTN